MCEPGSALRGYTIVRKLGEGAMGQVYEAIQHLTERRVAIKVMQPEQAQRADLVARFEREARVANRVGHPGLIQVTEFGEGPDGILFLVMDFAPGVPLSGRLREHAGRLPPRLAVHYARQMASALTAAHARGVVHRDLKPDNVMITPDPDVTLGERVRIVDFGIAKVYSSDSHPEDQVQTASGLIIGTPRYMAPEQCRSAKETTGQSDVYALGVILYEMLAGAPPFVGSVAELLGQHVSAEPPPLRRVAPWVPGPLVALVTQMLRKDPGLRPTMSQVEARLSALPQRRGMPLWQAGLAALIIGLCAYSWHLLRAAPVRLELTSDPSDAEVVDRNQHVVGKTPWTVQDHRGTVIEVQVRKLGHESKTVTRKLDKPILPLDKPITQHVVLRAVKQQQQPAAEPPDYFDMRRDAPRNPR